MDPQQFFNVRQSRRSVLRDTPHGFFRLSSVGGLLSNVAWPRLIANRSGGGKARNHGLHADARVPGRCQARPGFHAPRKGMNGPQLALGILGSGNTRLF